MRVWGFNGISQILGVKGEGRVFVFLHEGKEDIMNRRNSFKWALVIFIIAFLLSGCPTTSIKYSVKDTPVYTEAKPDKGLIYMLRSSWRASFMEIEMFMNEKPVGVTKGGTYFFCYLDPGDYILKAKAGGNVQQLTLDVERGKVYYVKQDFDFVGVITLKIIEAAEGQPEIKKLKYIESVIP